MSPCWLKQFTDSPCLYRADGLPDRAHLVPKQRLRQAGIEDVWDNRSWVLSCRRHHHLLDHGFLRLELGDYPRPFLDYCTEHGLYWAGNKQGWRAEYREAA